MSEENETLKLFKAKLEMARPVFFDSCIIRMNERLSIEILSPCVSGDDIKAIDESIKSVLGNRYLGLGVFPKDWGLRIVLVTWETRI